MYNSMWHGKISVALVQNRCILQVNIGTGVRIIAGSDATVVSNMELCANNVEAALTTPQALSLYPDLKVIDTDDLSTCAVRIDMNPELVISESVDCEVCPPDYHYDPRVFRCVYCECSLAFKSEPS